MGLNFVVELFLFALPETPLHIRPPAVFKMPAIAPESRSQRERSFSSCPLPAVVSRYSFTRCLFSETFHSESIHFLCCQPVQGRIERSRLYFQNVS